MICLTKAQRNALFRLFQRDFPSYVKPFRQNSITREKLSDTCRGLPFQFRQFGAHCGSDWPKPSTKCPRSFPYLALVMLFDAGPSTTSNRQTATIIWAAPPAPNWGRGLINLAANRTFWLTQKWEVLPLCWGHRPCSPVLIKCVDGLGEHFQRTRTFTNIVRRCMANEQVHTP